MKVRAMPMINGASSTKIVVLAYHLQGHGVSAGAAFRSNLQAYIELLLFIMVSMTYFNRYGRYAPVSRLTNLVGRQIT